MTQNIPERENLPTVASGKILYHYSYDIGGELNTEGLTEILSDIGKVKTISKRFASTFSPRFFELGFEPIEVKLGDISVNYRGSLLRLGIFCEVAAIGVLCIRLELPIENVKLEDLINLGDLVEDKILFNGKSTFIKDIAKDFKDKIFEKLSKNITFYYKPPEEPDTYIFFVVNNIVPEISPLYFFKNEPKLITAIIRGEKNYKGLSPEEVAEATKLWISYSQSDLAVVDWYSTLVSSNDGELNEDIVRVVELARMQLLELMTYDRILDKMIDNTYLAIRPYLSPKSLTALSWLGGESKKLSSTLYTLTEMRMDITGLVEDVLNATKVTGDWYLAKVYRFASERFRLKDWHDSVGRKLRELEEIYTIATDRAMGYRQSMFEFLIVLLIALEIIIMLITLT